MTRESTPARLGTLAYGLFAYASFHAIFLYLILFLADAIVPFSIENGRALPLAQALAIDAMLIALFAVQHTIMARPGFKRAWTRLIPEAMERSTFVLATVACLAVLFRFWVPVEGELWSVEVEGGRVVLYTLQALGWATLVWSTFLIDHWELFGVRQVIAHFQGKTIPSKTFKTPMLYGFVRHPMMVGVLLGFWATPDMTMSRFVFAVGFTCYVVLGIRIEERDLVIALGDDYRRYQERVPSLLPRMTRS